MSRRDLRRFADNPDVFWAEMRWRVRLWGLAIGAMLGLLVG